MNTVPQRRRRLVAATALLAGLSGMAAAESRPPLPVAEHLDLARYQGTWHEIARLPMFFQRHCVRGTTATYTAEADGIRVFNRCLDRSGEAITATGHARIGPEGNPAKLKVTFFWPFRADYWVIALDDDYRWALVGEPRRHYLWLLSRSPAMDRARAEAILDKARAAGYDLGDLIWAPQDDAAPAAAAS